MWQKKYGDENPAKKAARFRAWYERNAAENNAKSAEYYAANRAAVSARKRQYNHENLPKWRERAATRRAEDLPYRIVRAVRARIWSATKRRSKSTTSVELLGCSIESLLSYIEGLFHSGMSWDNWGKIWQIDHIRPLGSFDLSDPAQLAEACNHANLQPLLLDDHRSKTRADHQAIMSRKIGKTENSVLENAL